MLYAELIKSQFNEKLASMSGIEYFPWLTINMRWIWMQKREMQILKKVKREIGIEFFEKSHKNSRKFEHEIINLQTFRYD